MQTKDEILDELNNSEDKSYISQNPATSDQFIEYNKNKSTANKNTLVSINSSLGPSQGGNNLSEEEEIRKESIELLSFSQAIKSVSIQSIPFAISRLAVAANSIGNGIMFAKIGGDAVPAGALISSLQFVVLGTCRGALLSTSNIVGRQHGEKLKQEISRSIWQGWILGAALSVPTITILLCSENILKSAGISTSVAEKAQSYFVPFVIGVPATYWFTSDQQFALGIKRPKITLVASAAYGGLTMLIGYPLALSGELGVAGIGWGATASAIICLIGLRSYYWLNPEFNEYQLFNNKLKGILKEFSYMLKLSLSMGIQNTIEWANFFAISLMAGHLGKPELLGIEPSIHLLMSYNLILLGQAQATGVIVSNAIGKIRAASKDNKEDLANLWRRKARRLGNAGIFVGLSISLVAGSLFCIIPNQLTPLFIKESDTFNNTYSLAHDNLLINGIGLPFDSIRNLLISSLSGLKDIAFAPLLSFLFSTVGSLTSGYVLTSVAKLSSNWIFISRNGGIIIAAAGAGYRWLKQSSENEIRLLETRLSEQESLLGQNQNTYTDKITENQETYGDSKQTQENTAGPILSQFNNHKNQKAQQITGVPGAKVDEDLPTSTKSRNSYCDRCVIS